MWVTVALALLSAAAPDPSGRAPDSGLMDALRTSEAADIYIVSRNFHYPMDLQPYDVRTEGCAYRVYRLSPQWEELEQSLARANIRIVLTTARRQEVRFGLVLSDALGTVLEIYSNDLDWPNGQRPGVSQRRRVEISPGFVTALRAFADRHPDLAVPSRNCPGAARR